MAQKKPTLAEVAARAGVSSAAASFALSGRGRGIPQTTADRVWKAASELGYARRSIAKLRDWTRVAYLVPKLEHFAIAASFFANAFGQLQRLAVKNRFELFLVEFDAAAPEPERERRIHEMTSLGVEVALTSRRDDVKILLARGFKPVLVQGGVMPECICVNCEEHEAGRLAAVHALANGHLEAGVVFPPSAEPHPRLSGFLKGLKEGGGSCQDKFKWTVPSDFAKAVDKIERLALGRKKLPTLFFCFSDGIVFAAMKGFAKAGFKVPADISLIGVENLCWGARSTPSFTTVDLLEDIFAKRLVEAIRDAVADESPYAIASPVRLLARETVRSLLP